MKQAALLRSTTLAFAVSLALAGCGSQHKDAAPAAPSGNSSGSSSSNAAATHPSSSAAAALARPDVHTPDSAYTSLHSETHIMFYYGAYRVTPPNYKDMASVISHQYQATSDVFKKHALMKALKPIMDKKMAEAKAHPYVVWPMQNLALSDYSFHRHGFSVRGTGLLTGSDEYFSQDGGVNFNPYAITLRNSTQFGFLPVSSKALAKKIEYYVSHGNNCFVKIYMFADGAELSHRIVKADAVKIQLFSPNKTLLLTQYAQHFGN